MNFNIFRKKEKIDPAQIDELKTSFFIDLRPRIVKLPDFKEKEKINVRYPLIIPYASAHIYWDSELNELIYEVEEPILDDTEKELLKLIQLGLEEMINVSFVKTKKIQYLIRYLERNVQSIILELGAKISKRTYQKIMYYIYRNSMGLNEIEPLMNDYYIEDIECNGTKVPLYIVHRKYENIRTNVLFHSSHDLIDFVEKIAQKTGRYVSYAKPLLDGTLPDGSRVNATYTADITTRGPTFTIRKFTKEPWTPIHLIKFNTVSAEVFAYLWLAIENKFNVITIGETGSGKTTMMNSIVHFIPPEARICSIEDTRELNLAHENWLPAVTRSGFGIPNLVGGQYGEVTLFDLLRETFRQNPDYVIVGEVRGEETYVLFQGMASGHPSFSTFHAASIPSLVRRLATPPINLSPSLIESMNIVCVLKHIKTANRSVRRLKQIDEILKVKSGSSGDIETNVLFEWNPSKDLIEKNGESTIFDKIAKNNGTTVEKVKAEWKIRTKVLLMMVKNNITDFKEVNKLINEYYKEPKQVMKRFNIK
ncbi:MAG: type II/IV secretion system ATPase subunit [Candidatus Woesearchaeota archaeon]